MDLICARYSASSICVACVVQLLDEFGCCCCCCSSLWAHPVSVLPFAPCVLDPPVPDQSAQNSASNVSSPIGNSYSTQQYQSPYQSQGYGQQNHGGSSYQQPQQQQQQTLGQMQSHHHPHAQHHQQQQQHGYAHPSSPGRAQGGFGQDAGWGAPDADGAGVLPVVPLTSQYAASTSQSNSRRASLSLDTSASSASFPTSAFPTSPPNAMAQQLPLNHPSYAPAHLQQQGQQGGNQMGMQGQQHHQHLQHGTRYSVDELQSVAAVSASPSPSPPPTLQQGAFPTQQYSGMQPSFNPPMPASAYPLQPTSQQQPLQQQPPTLMPYGGPSTPAAAPALFHPAIPPPARRVLDENSMNPALSGPQPNISYGAGPPPPSQGMQHNGYSSNTLASPGRVLSPAFNTGGPSQQQPMGGAGQMVPSGNLFSQPPQPQQPLQQQQQYPPSQQYSPQQSHSLPSAAPSSSSGMPPPPPVSSYWKQRATVAPVVENPDRVVGRVDYSDLDYKSMDFAYNNRYEREQAQMAAGGAGGMQQQQQQYPAQGQSMPMPPPQQQQQSSYGGATQPSYGQPQQSTNAYPPPQGYSGYGR